MIKIHLHNKAKYEKEDPQSGIWLDLPVSYETLSNAFVALGLIGLHNHDYIITDFICKREEIIQHIQEEDSIFTINRLAKQIVKLSENEVNKLLSLAEYWNYYKSAELLQLINRLHSFKYIPNIKSFNELGFYHVNEYILPPLETLKYIKFADIGKKLMEKEKGYFSEYGYIAVKPTEKGIL